MGVGNWVYVNHLFKLMTNKIEFPLWLIFIFTAPYNKIVIKESYQLVVNSKHLQKKASNLN